jgi:hypothetical protein
LVTTSSIVAVTQVEHNAVASLASVSSITAAGTSIRLGAVSATGTSTLTLNAVLVKLGVVAAAGSSAIVATATVTHNAVAAIASVSSISSQTQVTHNAVAALNNVYSINAIGRVVAFFDYEGAGEVETSGAGEYGFQLHMEGDGRISVMGEATVTRFYGDRSKCDADEIRGISLLPNRHKDCFKSRSYNPERKKHIPKSLKGKAAILPAITVSRQNYFLPE